LKSPVAATSVPDRAEILPSLQPRRYNHPSPPESLAQDTDAAALLRELADCSLSKREAYYVRQRVPAAVRAELESLLQFDGETAGAIQGRIAAAANAPAAVILVFDLSALCLMGRRIAVGKGQEKGTVILAWASIGDVRRRAHAANARSPDFQEPSRGEDGGRGVARAVWSPRQPLLFWILPQSSRLHGSP
jgi:hypothetical protein